MLRLVLIPLFLATLFLGHAKIGSSVAPGGFELPDTNPTQNMGPMPDPNGNG